MQIWRRGAHQRAQDPSSSAAVLHVGAAQASLSIQPESQPCTPDCILISTIALQGAASAAGRKANVRLLLTALPPVFERRSRCSSRSRLEGNVRRLDGKLLQTCCHRRRSTPSPAQPPSVAAPCTAPASVPRPRMIRHPLRLVHNNRRQTAASMAVAAAGGGNGRQPFAGRGSAELAAWLGTGGIPVADYGQGAAKSVDQLW